MKTLPHKILIHYIEILRWDYHLSNHGKLPLF